MLNNGNISGATNQSYTTSSLTNGAVKIIRDDSCATTNTATSQMLTIQVSTGIKELS
jgi:hypothetical protein